MMTREEALREIRAAQGAERCANLRGADLRGADLRGADLCNANLRDADLRDADLRDANLYDANLYDANLCNADLRNANLCGANLRAADLTGIKTNYLTIGISLACPEVGAFIAWKKAGEFLVKLEVPADALRSSATTAKCRASHVRTLEVYDKYGNAVGEATSIRIGRYVVGEVTRCDWWDPDRWNECSGGIHFFMSRAHAEAWHN